MILSHAQRLIFTRPRKVASTSFEMAMSRHCGPRDVLTWLSPTEDAARRAQGGRGPQNHLKSLRTILTNASARDLAMLRNRRWPPRFYPHMPAAEIRAAMPAATWGSYLKVSLVRNPWDRMISNYHYWIKIFGRELPFDAWLNQNAGMISRNLVFYMIDGAVVIDRFIRIEHMREDLDALAEARPALAGVAETLPGLRAKARSNVDAGMDGDDARQRREAFFAPYPELRDAIGALCRFEVDTLGYRF